MVTQLVNIEKVLTTNDGFTITARDLNQTPSVLSAGQCPQTVHSVPEFSDTIIAFFDTPGNRQSGRQDFVIDVFFFDQADPLDAIWESRPRTVAFMDSFVTAIHQNPTLNGTTSIVQVQSVGLSDGQTYSGVQYRGWRARLRGWLYE